MNMHAIEMNKLSLKESVKNNDRVPSIERLWVYESEHPPVNFLNDYVEDLRLLNATQNSIEEFEIKYLYVRKGSQTIFVVPIFYTVFKITTMLNYKWLDPLIGRIGFKIAGLGSPMISYCRFEGELSREVLEAIASYLNTKCSLIAFKGFEPSPVFKGYVQAHSAPIAELHFDVNKWNEIKKSRNMSRKLRAAKDLRYEFRKNISEEELSRVYELYSNTYERAEIKFGKMTRSYFEKSNGNCDFILIYLHDKIVAYVQIFEKQKSAAAYLLGMDYSVDRKVGLYFGIYFGIMKWAEDNDIKFIEFGETAYQFKRKIGCTVEDCWIFYQHSNRLAHFILSKMKFLVEPSEETLR